ncbi:hypothetical protein BDK89_0264 [Ilumatobacter fluminis]|uniref:Uncharacterized protein n=1 Tax=Ilumatobacter fluminis TaxID=467091 RepID=A0A4R7HW23_9ACTN|nr:hypothetical protein [Ilumatobacter fluminis]TDT14709.1 hypothetical protein BDK89_0264 [Ilumatobacter fluminis]
MTRIISAIAAGLLFIGTAGCGTDDDADRDPVVDTTDAPSDVPTDAVDPAGAACPVGDADCYETGAETPADPPADPAGDATGAIALLA